MKILHIIDSGGLYGAEIMLLSLIQEQINLGMEPTICSIGVPEVEEKSLETEALKKGVNVKKVRMRDGPNIMGALKILKFAHEEHFSLIHAHGYKADIFFGFIPKIVRKLPLVSTVHGWTSTSRICKMKIYEWLDLKSLKYFDAVVLVNKAMLSIPKIRTCNLRNISIINNGISTIDCSIVNPSDTYGQSCAIDKEVIDFCREGFIIGALGRLSPEKGFDYLIDAVRQLRKDIRLKLVIIGDGPLKEKLQMRIKKMNLSDCVLLVGYVPHGRKYIKLFDVFVLPSLTEGLPITLLEAMQEQAPIVASKVGGIPDVLQGGLGGLLVEPADPESLATAIKKLYRDKELALQLVTFSFDEVNKRYTSKAMAMQYFEVYKKATQCFTSASKNLIW